MWMCLLRILSSARRYLLFSIEKNTVPSRADSKTELWTCFIFRWKGTQTTGQDCFWAKTRVQMSVDTGSLQSSVWREVMLPDWIILHRWLANRGKSVGVASGLMWLTLHAHTPIIARHACIHHHTRTHMHTPCSNIVGCLRTHIKGVLSLSLERKVACKNLNVRLFNPMRSRNQIWSNALFFFLREYSHGL